MEAPWERAEVSCPNCLEILVLRPSVEEIWCQRCESGYDVMESRSPRDPERTVLFLRKQESSEVKGFWTPASAGVTAFL
jgi:hypothetical protein